MFKRMISAAAITSFIFGCTTLMKSNSIESEDHASNKGLTRSIAQEVTAAVTASATVVVALPELPVLTDPNLIYKNKKGDIYDCRTIVKVKYTFKGKVYEKLRLDDDIQLKCPNVKSFNQAMPWKVTKDSWSQADEQGYSAFVKKLGYGKCNNLDKCLSSESINSLISEEDMKNIYYSDCADLPYYVRAYYAYKNQLPFSFVSGTQPVALNPEQQARKDKERENILLTQGEEGIIKFEKKEADTRYSLNGNIPVSQSNTPNTKGIMRDFSRVKLVINDAVSTGTYRMLQGDFYSPKITPEEIRPGTAVYGTKGHAALIYDVKPNGDLLVMDAHPGNSITHNGWIEQEFIMDGMKHGGMFKNFRPLKVRPITVDKITGEIKAGQVIQASDEEISGYSLEQYDSNNFVNKGSKISMREWVSLRLSGGNYKLNPVAEMIERTTQLCENYKGRASDVQKAFDFGLTKQSIEKYPTNIYGADQAEWETHSTPSSDLRRRSDTLSLLEFAKESIHRVNAKDPLVSYSGTNLKTDLVNAFKSTALACNITYKNSLGTPLTLNLLHMSKRVGLFSFDPYMCPEIRWGASGAEAVTCTDSATKKEFYKLTQFLRNNNIKDEKAIHGYSIQNLRQLEATKKVNNNPAVNNYDIATQMLGL